MATCFNKNTAEYQALEAKFEKPIVVDSIINGWQKVNSSDLIPTVTQAEEFLSKQNLFDTVQGRALAEIILENLRDKKLISRLYGKFYINNTPQGSTVSDPATLALNKKKIERLLEVWGITPNAVVMEETPKAFRISIDHTKLKTRDDIIPSKDTIHTADIISHLTRLFPDVKIRVLDEAQAKQAYDALPQFKDGIQKKQDFKNIKSFYSLGYAILIKGRVNSETAIEEVLHPFINAIESDANVTLFPGLVKEARKTFPILRQEIDRAYRDKDGFDQTYRDKELVTQALSRHFKKEYEGQPTMDWRYKVKQILQWLMDVIKDLNAYITGESLQLSPAMIRPGTNMSDIAKLLNTGGLSFNIEKSIKKDTGIYYSMTKQKKAVYEELKNQAQSPQQKIVLEQLFHASIADKAREYGDFTVGITGSQNHPLVILNKADHKYINIETLEEYNGVTTKAGGYMSKSHQIKKGEKLSNILKKYDTNKQELEKLNPIGTNLTKLEDSAGDALTEIYVPEKDFELNVELGNEMDSIVEAYALGEDISTLDLKILTPETARRFYNDITNRLKGISRSGLLIPQVVIADAVSGTAGSIDLLMVNKDGSMDIIDLKTSKSSIYEMHSKGIQLKQDVKYPVKYGSMFYNPALKHEDQQKFSKRQLQALQVNSYRTILQNMGFNVDQATTLHVNVRMKGKGKNQKFLQDFVIEDEINHAPSQDVRLDNGTFALDQIVTPFVDPYAEQKLDDAFKRANVNPTELVDDEAQAEQQALAHETEQSILEVLMNYDVALITRDKAINKLQDSTKLIRSKQDMISEIQRTSSMINAAIVKGEISPAYTKLLEQGIETMDEFIEYAHDEANWNSEEYISVILNFQKMINTYEGLTSIKNIAGLKPKQKTLVLKLIEKLNEVNGEYDGLGNIKEGKEGIINDSIDNYVKTFIKNYSSRDFSEAELENLLLTAKDIGLLEYQTGDMATSRDTILALMDKLYKRKVQEVLDKIEMRNAKVRKLAKKIEKLGGKDYNFMLVLDDNGLPTGHYVKQIGQEYYKMRRKLSDALKDEEGNPLEYVVKDNLSDLTAEEIQHNKKLHAARKAFGDFAKAERVLNDVRYDGKYHKYTKEFMVERSKYMIFRKGKWRKKTKIDDIDFQTFQTKYYETKEYFKAGFTNDQMNGHVKVMTDVFVKPEYVEKRQISADGKDMRSAKYKKLMNPPAGNALAQAQKEFYEMYVEMFENDLLKKLPMHVNQQMVGRMPLIKETALRKVKNSPNIVASLWSKVISIPKNTYNYFFTKTYKTKVVLTDENGQFTNTLPIYYVGNPKNEETLQKIDNEINALTDQRKANKITEGQFTEKLEDLKRKRNKIQSRPALNEISTDMADNLIKFSAMAEHYEIMNGVEDTLSAMIKVLEKRQYEPADGSKITTFVKGKLQKVGIKAKTALEEPLIVKRAKKWMKMVYYDNDEETQGFFDKVAKGLISYTSLTYVGMNPFGNINNYAIGRLNNFVETMGGRYYDRKAGLRATTEFNKRMIPDFFKRIAYGQTFVGDITGLGPSQYDKYRPGSKYEALVDYFRMMDDKADIREQNRLGAKKESTVRRAMSWGYMIQDAAEYNVQTKVGMATLMSTKIKNSKTNDVISLFDAYQYNQQTGELTMKDGYDTLINYQSGKETKWDENARYDIRNYIREVNKQIHGNYAYQDRMVMQSHSLGHLAAQFHKWIAPAIKARYREEYFDENLGWVEGRYRTFTSFVGHLSKNLLNMNKAVSEWKEGQDPDKVRMKMENVYRTTAELTLIMATFMLKVIVSSLFDDEDEDKTAARRRAENALLFQLDRQRREMIQFLPVVGWYEAYNMMKNPISSIRMLSEMQEAMVSMVQTPYLYLIKDEDEFYLDTRVVYQRGDKKGSLKLNKELRDVAPGLYALNRWLSYDTIKNFHVK
tara:strand:- start:396 stop:6152 length:5757 start_codon:yes stop_codon:yes gene_type:complete